MTTALDRFNAKVLREHGPGGCWLWQASGRNGYGTFYVGTGQQDRRTVQAHRYSYEHYVGPIPQGLDLDHLCRVRHCVNPLHLEPVTRQINILRGVSPQAVNAAKTHCLRGHPFNEANTRLYRGQRRCRACDRNYQREKRNQP